MRSSEAASLHTLLLGDGDLPQIPARMSSSSWGTPALYLGDKDAAADFAVLDELGIRAIVNASSELPNLFEGRMRYLHVELEDAPEEELLPHVSRTNSFIDDAIHRGESVLVHCRFGVSRSASLVIAYFMCKQH